VIENVKFVPRWVIGRQRHSGFWLEFGWHIEARDKTLHLSLTDFLELVDVLDLFG